MLNVIFTKEKAKSKVVTDSRMFFSTHKKAEWFQDPFVQQIVKTVEDAEVIDGFVLKGKYCEAMPPEYLSTGSKTAICVYEFPDTIFNFTQMGDNAFQFVIMLAKTRDVTGLCYRDLPWNLMQGIVFAKDYEVVDISDPDEFTENIYEWLEESANDSY